MGLSQTNGRRRKGLVSEINVTPLVDVMLVLLIIFMVTAPMMTQGLDVDLPETTSKSLPNNDKHQIITLDKDGKLSFNGTPTSRVQLVSELEKMSPEMKQEPVYLRADKDATYGAVATLMADIKSAGIDKLGMITKPEEKAN